MCGDTCCIHCSQGTQPEETVNPRDYGRGFSSPWVTALREETQNCFVNIMYRKPSWFVLNFSLVTLITK